MNTTFVASPDRRRPSRQLNRANMGGRVSVRHSMGMRMDREGSAAVEAAIILPLLLVFTVAVIDVCGGLFLRETLVIAAYEGARQGISRDRTDAEVVAAVEGFLQSRNVDFTPGSAVTINPSFDSAGALTPVTVTVSVPCAGNLVSPADLFGERNMSASVVMRKEFQNR